MSIKHRLPFLLLPVILLLSENFFPFLSPVTPVAQAAPSVSPKKGQKLPALLFPTPVP